MTTCQNMHVFSCILCSHKTLWGIGHLPKHVNLTCLDAWCRICHTSCHLWTWQQNPSPCGGPPISSTPLLPERRAKDEKWSLGTSQKIPFTEGWVAQKWINMAHLDGRLLNHFPALLLSSFEKPWISSIQVGDIRSPQDCGRIQLLLRGYLTLFGRLLQRWHPKRFPGMHLGWRRFMW